MDRGARVNQDCLKLTTYFGERDRSRGQLLADVLLDLYERHGIQTSVLLRGIEGFGLGQRMHTDRVLTLSEDLPVVAVAIDTRERIEAVLAEALALERHGLLTLERARLLTGELTIDESPRSESDETKLTVYVGRQERVGGVAAFQAVCELLHRRGISGATVLLGVDGMQHGVRTRARFFGRNADVPMMVIAVGRGDDIDQALPELEALLEAPQITLERIRVCKRDGQRFGLPEQLPETDEHGLALWQKLMIHSSEAARFDGHPLHRTLVNRLRAGHLAGATCVRGIWGFHGDHAPHGDKLLQLHRHAPVVTIAVDTPERIAAAFPVVDEVTSEAGLVTSEMVPTARGRRPPA